MDSTCYKIMYNDNSGNATVACAMNQDMIFILLVILS